MNDEQLSYNSTSLLENPQPHQQIKKKKHSKMYEDIEEMMYGFGDTHQWPPDENSVRLIETMVINYIEDLSIRASDVAELKSKDGKIDKECFMFVVRKDRRKFNRIYRLLKANEELKSAQKLELNEEQV
jgi:hypothetical protein